MLSTGPGRVALLCAWACALVACSATAQIPIGNEPIPHPAVGAFPGTLDVQPVPIGDWWNNPHEDELTGSGFLWSCFPAAPDPGEPPDPFLSTSGFTFAIANISEAMLTKVLTISIFFNSIVGFDNPFDPNQWPSVSAPGSSSFISAASVIVAENSTLAMLQVHLRPQPAIEFVNVSNLEHRGLLPFIERIRFEIMCVPEPQTWAMLIVGFGVIGGAMRRRRGKEAVTS
jgi:hypothetical protein